MAAWTSSVCGSHDPGQRYCPSVLVDLQTLQDDWLSALPWLQGLEGVIRLDSTFIKTLIPRSIPSSLRQQSEHRAARSSAGPGSANRWVR